MIAGIAAALDLCDAADCIILCLGEAAVMSGEASSRAHLGLPGMQRNLPRPCSSERSARESR